MPTALSLKQLHLKPWLHQQKIRVFILLPQHRAELLQGVSFATFRTFPDLGLIMQIKQFSTCYIFLQTLDMAEDGKRQPLGSPHMDILVFLLTQVQEDDLALEASSTLLLLHTLVVCKITVLLADTGRCI